MAAPPDIRSQLRSLSIAKEQRPASTAPTVAGPRNGRIGWLIGSLLVIALAAAVYVSRDRLSSLAGSAAATAD